MSLSSNTLTKHAVTQGKYYISKQRSIFVKRRGRNDIVIHIETNQTSGALYNGKYYTIAMIIDPETLQPIRVHYSVPDEILQNLKKWGF